MTNASMTGANNTRIEGSSAKNKLAALNSNKEDKKQ